MCPPKGEPSPSEAVKIYCYLETRGPCAEGRRRRGWAGAEVGRRLGRRGAADPAHDERPDRAWRGFNGRPKRRAISARGAEEPSLLGPPRAVREQERGGWEGSRDTWALRERLGAWAGDAARVGARVRPSAPAAPPPSLASRVRADHEGPHGPRPVSLLRRRPLPTPPGETVRRDG